MDAERDSDFVHFTKRERSQFWKSPNAADASRYKRRPFLF